jgi:hypothetical protein
MERVLRREVTYNQVSHAFLPSPPVGSAGGAPCAIHSEHRRDLHHDLDHFFECLHQRPDLSAEHDDHDDDKSHDDNVRRSDDPDWNCGRLLN